MAFIHVIVPYKDKGVWMFDDPSHGLEREAFVAGADDIIEKMVSFHQIKDPEKGFVLIFASIEFPGCQQVFNWERSDGAGNWYTDGTSSGWLCPALMKYFDEVPRKLYTEVREMN